MQHTHDTQSAVILLAMSEMEEVGALIKRSREKKGLTQGQLGNLIGYSSNFVSRLEAGSPKNPPTPETLRELERILGLPGLTKKLLVAMGYLSDLPIEEGGDTITIRRDDPRADLLARLDDATDDEIDTIKGIINVIVQHGPRRSTEGVSSDGKPKQSDDAGGRTA